MILRRPGALFLLPLAALGILSTKMGGRMVMFGAPIVAIGLSMPLFWLLRAGLARPLQDNSKNRDTGPCGSVSLLLMRFYAFLKPTLCMNLTKAA